MMFIFIRKNKTIFKKIVSITPFFILLMKKLFTKIKKVGNNMIIWKYTILTNAGPIITKDVEYAEKKRKLGYRIFCKRENNIYKFNH